MDHEYAELQNIMKQLIEDSCKLRNAQWHCFSLAYNTANIPGGWNVEWRDPYGKCLYWHGETPLSPLREALEALTNKINAEKEDHEEYLRSVQR